MLSAVLCVLVMYGALFLGPYMYGLIYAPKRSRGTNCSVSQVEKLRHTEYTSLFALFMEEEVYPKEANSSFRARFPDLCWALYSQPCWEPQETRGSGTGNQEAKCLGFLVVLQRQVLM